MLLIVCRNLRTIVDHLRLWLKMFAGTQWDQIKLGPDCRWNTFSKLLFVSILFWDFGNAVKHYLVANLCHLPSWGNVNCRGNSETCRHKPRIRWKITQFLPYPPYLYDASFIIKRQANKRAIYNPKMILYLFSISTASDICILGKHLTAYFLS